MPNPLNQSEKQVESAGIRYAKSLGWVVRKQSGQGARGKTDRMFLKNGNAVFVEFKAPGKEPTVKQLNEISILKDIGFQAGWFDSVGSFKLWLNAIDEHFNGLDQ